jgi:hypothetical protein
VERGGRPLDVVVRVQDLHEITPASFLSVSGGVVHALSYQLACGYSVPVVRPPATPTQGQSIGGRRTLTHAVLVGFGVCCRGGVHALHGGRGTRQRHYLG